MELERILDHHLQTDHNLQRDSLTVATGAAPRRYSIIQSTAFLVARMIASNAGSTLWLYSSNFKRQRRWQRCHAIPETLVLLERSASRISDENLWKNFFRSPNRSKIKSQPSDVKDERVCATTIPNYVSYPL
jgi:hypothetical protein